MHCIDRSVVFDSSRTPILIRQRDSHYSVLLKLEVSLYKVDCILADYGTCIRQLLFII